MLYVPTSLNWPSAIAIAGLAWAMFFLKFTNLYSAYGITLFANQNATMLKRKIKMIKTRMALCNEIPEDFMAANS
ncbi:hypothetical protein D3C80_1835230 [compost metagenome]